MTQYVPCQNFCYNSMSKKFRTQKNSAILESDCCLELSTRTQLNAAPSGTIKVLRWDFTQMRRFLTTSHYQIYKKLAKTTLQETIKRHFATKEWKSNRGIFYALLGHVKKN